MRAFRFCFIVSQSHAFFKAIAEKAGIQDGEPDVRIIRTGWQKKDMSEFR